MNKFYTLPILLFGISFLTSKNVKAQFYPIGLGISVSDVNNNGVAVGSQDFLSTIRWTAEDGLTVLGTLDQGDYSGIALVGNDGNKVVGVATNPLNGLIETSIYDVTTSTWTHLGGLASLSDYSKSSAWGLSEDGTTIVGLGWVDAGTEHATKWTTEGVFDIGSTVEGSSSRANAISDDKSVIVGWQDAIDGTRQAAVWINGEQTLLFDSEGFPLDEAGAISGDGQTVIGNGFPLPYIWKRDGSISYISHPNANTFFRGSATGITADGNKIVGYFRPWPGAPHFGEGFIWDPENGRQELMLMSKT